MAIGEDSPQSLSPGWTSALKGTLRSRMWESRLSGSERGVGGNRLTCLSMVEL